MALLYILSLIGDPVLALGGVGVGLLARQWLHLSATPLVPLAWLLLRSPESGTELFVPALVVALGWSCAAFFAKKALRSK